ncbi:uncharacterized protein LOC130838031 [Hippopotamus amphibius kiboko]|uniref:uncharacterized protein LOC130838031 n=1 Tax=Hippopotamus amphibius kiboko TaxID=575201 RepID=UPI00259767EC|nr:uncharacterized protein LOC130838031 [Hippopotamus amphibius kiboko]
MHRAEWEFRVQCSPLLSYPGQSKRKKGSKSVRPLVGTQRLFGCKGVEMGTPGKQRACYSGGLGSKEGSQLPQLEAAGHREAEEVRHSPIPRGEELVSRSRSLSLPTVVSQALQSLYPPNGDAVQTELVSKASEAPPLCRALSLSVVRRSERCVQLLRQREVRLPPQFPLGNPVCLLPPGWSPFFPLDSSSVSQSHKRENLGKSGEAWKLAVKEPHQARRGEKVLGALHEGLAEEEKRWRPLYAHCTLPLAPTGQHTHLLLSRGEDKNRPQFSRGIGSAVVTPTASRVPPGDFHKSSGPLRTEEGHWFCTFLGGGLESSGPPPRFPEPPTVTWPAGPTGNSPREGGGR